jgi:hypothetical protein
MRNKCQSMGSVMLAADYLKPKCINLLSGMGYFMRPIIGLPTTGRVRAIPAEQT